MPNYTRDGNYDINLISSGSGWLGTFAATVSSTAADILTDGEPYGPVTITTGPDSPAPDMTITGTLTEADAQALTVVADDDARTVHRIPVNTVVRFSA